MAILSHIKDLRLIWAVTGDPINKNNPWKRESSLQDCKDCLWEKTVEISHGKDSDQGSGGTRL